MIVDSSALMALLLEEPGSEILGYSIVNAQASMCAANVLEVCMAIRKHAGDNAERLVAAELDSLGIKMVAFGAEHVAEANDAFLRFGKGRHRASLNFGDCMAYATAKCAGQPLLYTGNDFVYTDIARAGHA